MEIDVGAANYLVGLVAVGLVLEVLHEVLLVVGRVDRFLNEVLVVQVVSSQNFFDVAHVFAREILLELFLAQDRLRDGWLALACFLLAGDLLAAHHRRLLRNSVFFTGLCANFGLALFQAPAEIPRVVEVGPQDSCGSVGRISQTIRVLLDRTLLDDGADARRLTFLLVQAVNKIHLIRVSLSHGRGLTRHVNLVRVQALRVLLVDLVLQADDLHIFAALS